MIFQGGGGPDPLLPPPPPTLLIRTWCGHRRLLVKLMPLLVTHSHILVFLCRCSYRARVYLFLQNACRWSSIARVISFRKLNSPGTYRIYVGTHWTCMPIYIVGLEVYILVQALDSQYRVYASSEDSDKTARMLRLVQVFTGRTCDKYQNLMCWLIYVIICALHFLLRLYAYILLRTKESKLS